MKSPQYRILTPAQFHLQRWKNGGGSTLELWRWPAEGEDFSVRISVATVGSSGPFSKFPEVDRTIIQLSGPPIILTHDSAPPLALKIGVPHNFAGEATTLCEVNGESLDFNVMARRGRAQSTCSVISGGESTPLLLRPQATCLVYNAQNSTSMVRLESNVSEVSIPPLHLMEIRSDSVSSNFDGIVSALSGLTIVVKVWN